MKQMIIATSLALSLIAPLALAEDTMDTKAKEGWEDTKKNVKKAWRNAKGEWCEMINGKAECVMKRAGNKIKDTVDEGKDKLNIDQ